MKQRRGFTLIELMVTLVITATVFAMVGGILVSVIDATEKVDLKLRYEKAGYGALGLIRRDLSGVYAYALGGLAFKGESKDQFGKAADEVHFVTTANVVPVEPGEQRPRLVEVGYRLDKADDQTLTLYRRAEALEGDPITSGGDYEEVLSGVATFELEYLDPTDKAWKESWDKPDALPAAVRCTLELALKEADKVAAEEIGVEIPLPRYQLVVGIAADVAPAAEEPPAQQPGQPPGGGQPPPPGG